MIYHGSGNTCDYNLIKCGIRLPNTDFCMFGSVGRLLNVVDLLQTKVLCGRGDWKPFHGDSGVNQTRLGWENNLVTLRSSLLICPDHISWLVSHELDPFDVGNAASVVSMLTQFSSGLKWISDAEHLWDVPQHVVVWESSVSHNGEHVYDLRGMKTRTMMMMMVVFWEQLQFITTQISFLLLVYFHTCGSGGGWVLGGILVLMVLVWPFLSTHECRFNSHIWFSDIALIYLRSDWTPKIESGHPWEEF